MIKTIAVVVVMLIVNLLMIYSISRSAKRVDYSLRRFFIQRLSIEDLGVELPEMDGSKAKDSEKSEQKGRGGLNFGGNAGHSIRLLARDNVSSASYKNGSIIRDYKAIKKISEYTPAVALSCAKKQIEKTSSEDDYKDYAGLLSLLDYDAVFSMSVLDPELQEALVRSIASEAQQSIVDDYIEETQRDFDGINFQSYLSQMAEMYNSGFCIKTGDADMAGKSVDDAVLIYDNQICEGSQVLYKNKLYDYSI